MRRYIILGALCLTGGLLAAACNDATEDVTIFRATLAGNNEVPAVSTAASGNCGLQVEGNLVRYTIEVHGATGVVGGHIHSGAAGANGSIRVNLYPSTTTSFATSGTGPVDGILIEGTFSPSDVRGISYEQLLNDMRAGAMYCNVHTESNRSGLIRGQVQPVSLD